MTIQDWLRTAVEDARRRGLPALEPLLEGVSKSTTALREAERRMDLDDSKDGEAGAGDARAAGRL